MTDMFGKRNITFYVVSEVRPNGTSNLTAFDTKAKALAHYEQALEEALSRPGVQQLRLVKIKVPADVNYQTYMWEHMDIIETELKAIKETTVHA